VNIVASAALLTAGGTIGAAGNPLDTQVATLSAHADGNIYLYESTGVAVDEVVFGGVNRVGLDSSSTTGTGAATQSDLESVSGSVALVVDDGSITVNDGGDADGVGVSAMGDVLLDAYNNGHVADIELNADVIAGGSVSVYADDDIRQNADITADGTIDAEAFEGSITMADGTVSQTTAGGNIGYAAWHGDVTLGLLDAGAGMVAVYAQGDILDARNDTVGHDVTGLATQTGLSRTENIIASSALLGANGMIGVSGNPLDIDVGTIAASAGGSIYLYESSGVTVGDVAFAGVDRVLFDGTPMMTGVEADRLAGLTAGVNAKIETITGDLTVDEAVTAMSGDVLLAAGNTGSVTLNAGVTAYDDVSVLAAQNITQNAAGDITAGGTIDVEAFAGSITMAVGSESQTTADGNIRYAALGDVTLNGILRAGNGNVAVEAGGDIRDDGNIITISGNGYANGNDAVNIYANQVSLRAGGNIGDTGTGTSGIRPFNPITVVANGVAAQGDNIALYSKPDMIIGSVGDISVTRVTLDDVDQTETSLALSGIDAGTGVVNLMADHSVIDGTGAGTDITAGTMVISAGHIIGSGFGVNQIDPLEINLSGGPGTDIWINNVAGSDDNFVYAFFDTVGGQSHPSAGAKRESGALIFINGMYAGGDPQYVNLFAAVESYPAETPELKSRQGVFGDPFFLHDQMDINESVALGLIDFILTQKAQIVGDPELSVDVYEDMAAGALSPTTSIWFGKDHEKKEPSSKTQNDEKQAGSKKAEPVQLTSLR